jgi:ABC-type multidrug transport system permease subunit
MFTTTDYTILYLGCTTFYLQKLFFKILLNSDVPTFLLELYSMATLFFAFYISPLVFLFTELSFDVLISHPLLFELLFQSTLCYVDVR